MASYSAIQKKYGGNICRRCINEQYKVELSRSDCWYGNPYPMRCHCCGEMSNLVLDLRMSGKLKLLFK